MAFLFFKNRCDAKEGWNENILFVSKSFSSTWRVQSEPDRRKASIIKDEMKTTLKNRTSIVVFLSGLIFFLAAMHGCAGLKEASGITGEGKGEILVARDVANRRPAWCGQKTSLVYSVTDYDESAWEEVYRYDIEAGRNIKIVDQGSPIACTPDGEWLLYRDRSSYRIEKDDSENAVVDLWRYEFKTKRLQRIATASEPDLGAIGEGIISPSGRKLYLGREPGESIEMPAPKWETLWSRSKMHNSVWLSDSSGMVGTYFNWEDRKEHIAIQQFTPEEKLIVLRPPSARPVRSIQVAGRNRIYMRIHSGGEGVDGHGKDLVFSCDINRSEATLSCVDMLEIDRNIQDYDLLSDGETMVFMEEGDRCVRVRHKGEKGAPCITAPKYDLGNHLTISPDGRWVAFTVFRKRDDGTSYTEDLYVVKLADD